MQRARQCRKNNCGEENSWSGHLNSQPYAWLSDSFSAVQGVSVHSPHDHQDPQASSLNEIAWHPATSQAVLYMQGAPEHLGYRRAGNLETILAELL